MGIMGFAFHRKLSPWQRETEDEFTQLDIYFLLSSSSWNENWSMTAHHNDLYVANKLYTSSPLHLLSLISICVSRTIR